MLQMELLRGSNIWYPENDLPRCLSNVRKKDSINKDECTMKRLIRYYIPLLMGEEG